MKEKIKTTATQMFMKFGVRSVSMDDIARAMGISKKTLYQHIADKKSLVFEALEDFIQKDCELIKNILKQKDVDALDQMVQITTKAISITRKYKPTVIFDLKKYHKDAWNLVDYYQLEFMQAVIKENIEKGKQENIYREDVDGDIISSLFVRKMQSIVEQGFFTPQYKIEYVFMQQLLYHLYGIVSQGSYPRLKSITSQLHDIPKI